MWDAVQTRVNRLTCPHTVRVEKVTAAAASAAAAAADSFSQAADHSPPVPLPSNVLCIPAGLSLWKQTHYPHRQKRGGGQPEVMIHRVQVKLSPLITTLIGQNVISLFCLFHLKQSLAWLSVTSNVRCCFDDGKSYLLSVELFSSVNTHLPENEEKLVLKFPSSQIYFKNIETQQFAKK